MGGGAWPARNEKLIIKKIFISLFLGAVGEREAMNCLELSRALQNP